MEISSQCNASTEYCQSLFSLLAIGAALVTYLPTANLEFQQRCVSDLWPACVRLRGLKLNLRYFAPAYASASAEAATPVDETEARSPADEGTENLLRTVLRILVGDELLRGWQLSGLSGHELITSCVCHITRFEPVLFVESEVEPDARRRVHQLLERVALSPADASLDLMQLECHYAGADWDSLIGRNEELHRADLYKSIVTLHAPDSLNAHYRSLANFLLTLKQLSPDSPVPEFHEEQVLRSQLARQVDSDALHSTAAAGKRAPSILKLHSRVLHFYSRRPFTFKLISSPTSRNSAALSQEMQSFTNVVSLDHVVASRAHLSDHLLLLLSRLLQFNVYERHRMLLAHSKVSSEYLARIRALIALEMRELIGRRTIYVKDGASARLDKLVHMQREVSAQLARMEHCSKAIDAILRENYSSVIRLLLHLWKLGANLSHLHSAYELNLVSIRKFSALVELLLNSPEQLEALASKGEALNTRFAELLEEFNARTVIASVLTQRRESVAAENETGGAEEEAPEQIPASRAPESLAAEETVPPSAPTEPLTERPASTEPAASSKEGAPTASGTGTAAATGTATATGATVANTARSDAEPRSPGEPASTAVGVDVDLNPPTEPTTDTAHTTDEAMKPQKESVEAERSNSSASGTLVDEVTHPLTGLFAGRLLTAHLTNWFNRAIIFAVLGSRRAYDCVDHCICVADEERFQRDVLETRQRNERSRLVDELLRQLDTNAGGDKVKSVSRTTRDAAATVEASRCELNEERFNLVCNVLLDKLQSLLGLNAELLDQCDSMLHEGSEDDKERSEEASGVKKSRASVRSETKTPSKKSFSPDAKPPASTSPAVNDAGAEDTARDAPDETLPEDPATEQSTRTKAKESFTEERPIRLARAELRSCRSRLLSGYSQYVQSLMLSNSDSLLCRFLLLLVAQRFTSAAASQSPQAGAGDGDKSEMESTEKAEHFFHSDAELVVLLYSERLVQLLLTHHKRLKEAKALPSVPHALPAFLEAREDQLELWALLNYLSEISPDLSELCNSLEKQSAQWDQWFSGDCDPRQLPQVGKKSAASTSRRAFVSLLLTSLFRRELFVPQLRSFVRALEAGSSGGSNTSEEQQLPVRVLRESEFWRGCLVLCGKEDVEEVRSAMDEVALQLAGNQSGGEKLLDDTPRAEEQHITPMQNTILDVRVEAIANHESIAIVQNLVEAIDPERDSLAAIPHIRPMRLVALAAPRLRELLEQPTAAARLRYFLVVPASLMLKLGASQKADPATAAEPSAEAPNEAAEADSLPDQTQTKKASASPKSRSVTPHEDDTPIDLESL